MVDEFVIKDLGNLKYFPGMEVARSREGISVSSRKHILDLLKVTCMIGYVDTCIEFNAKLRDYVDKVPVDKEGINIQWER